MPHPCCPGRRQFRRWRCRLRCWLQRWRCRLRCWLRRWRCRLRCWLGCRLRWRPLLRWCRFHSC
ncbi:MAG: hypothetical protein EA402_04100 [Planctomycetota bacterium]|nr:MAG: hypothetical protein EA402_04100 [Planctomycetota bacterium]